MKQYSYVGPVLEFGKVVANRWEASTYAVSESKAKCNLAYRFKKENNKTPATKIALPGKIVAVE